MCDLCPPSDLPWSDPNSRPMDDIGRVINHRGLPGNPFDPYNEPEESEGTMERGRQLASERDDLIAQGVDPADLVVPLAPKDC